MIHSLQSCTRSFAIEIVGTEVTLRAVLNSDYYDTDTVTVTGATYELAVANAVDAIAAKRNARPAPAGLWRERGST